MSTALVQVNKFEQVLVSAKERITSLLGKDSNPDRFINSVLATVAKDTKLQNCTPESILEACYDAATLGLAIDARYLAYLVPYGNKAKLMASYKGMVELALKSGVVTNIFAEVVYEKDHFQYHAGTIQNIDHIPVKMNVARGNVVGAYAVARYANGIIQPCVMRLDEINKIRNKSRSSGAGPWVTDFDEMAKKTVVKRLIKLLPSNVIPIDAYRIEDEHFDFSQQNKASGEQPVVKAEDIPVEPVAKAITSAPLSEEDCRKACISEIYNLSYYNAAISGTETPDPHALDEKYKSKSLDALMDIVNKATAKVKPVIIQAIMASQFEEHEHYKLVVPQAEKLHSREDALALDAAKLWQFYEMSVTRIELEQGRELTPLEQLRAHEQESWDQE